MERSSIAEASIQTTKSLALPIRTIVVPIITVIREQCRCGFLASIATKILEGLPQIRDELQPIDDDITGEIGDGRREDGDKMRECTERNQQ